VATQYDWPEATRSKIEYCGYVCASPPPDASELVRSRYLGSSGGSLVVVMAGGGADAYPLFDALISAVPMIRADSPCHVVLITGPFLPAPLRQELAARADGLPVDVLTSVPDPMAHAASADLVVAMAGYNTTTEILSVGTPALLVPRAGPSAEQQMRASLFAERGWVDWLRPQDLSAEALAGSVGRALRRPRRTGDVPPPDLRGRTVAGRRLVESLNGHRPAALSPVRSVPRPTELVSHVADDDYLLA
jgi:predicted glycosyltransferase